MTWYAVKFDRGGFGITEADSVEDLPGFMTPIYESVRKRKVEGLLEAHKEL